MIFCLTNRLTDLAPSTCSQETLYYFWRKNAGKGGVDHILWEILYENNKLINMLLFNLGTVNSEIEI